MSTNARKSGTVARLVMGADPVRRAIYLAGIAPAIWYFYLGLTEQLGIDPQNMLERALGLWALRFLIAGLAITPLRRLGGPSLLRYRRAVGLLAFYYASLHLSVYMVLDQGLDFAEIGTDIMRRPYITLGMSAFVILIALAMTSNNAIIRRLGGARWQRLHRFVYVAVIAAVLHFIMLAKVWYLEPLIYAGLAVLLLGLRLTPSPRSKARRKPA